MQTFINFTDLGNTAYLEVQVQCNSYHSKQDIKWIPVVEIFRKIDNQVAIYKLIPSF